VADPLQFALNMSRTNATPDLLANIPVFSSLTSEERKAIASLMTRRDEAAGTVLVGEGSRGYDLFVILEGSATVTTGDRSVATLERGDFFGEIALLADGIRSASVTAATPVELVVMHGSDFRVFERDWPHASELMRRALRERLARTGATGD
jgi:CRP/FNR family cyclic AMP-dependent transcriptional regulator